MTKRLVFLALVAMFAAVPGPRSILAATPAPNGSDEARNVYYTIAFTTGTAELWAIEVTEGKVATTDIGPINTGCAALAMSPSGKLVSMCGALFGDQQLTSIDTKTGLGTSFGVPVPGLAVMSMAFAPNGVLYAVGDCNPDFTTLQCGSGSPADPNYNSLYTVNVVTGAFTRVGSTGAPQFFMDLAFDREGNMWGVTTCLSPCYVPAILYRINTETGAATKVADLVGSNNVMGLAFAPDGKLYATDWVQSPGLYVIDPKTGLERAVAAMPFGFSTALELADPLP